MDDLIVGDVYNPGRWLCKPLDNVLFRGIAGNIMHLYAENLDVGGRPYTGEIFLTEKPSGSWVFPVRIKKYVLKKCGMNAINVYERKGGKTWKLEK